MSIRFLDPTQAAEVLPASLATRPLEDRALSLGLLSNSKQNSALLLRRLGEQLGKVVPIHRTVEYAKASSSTNAPDELLDQMADQCDLALVAVGD